MKRIALFLIPLVLGAQPRKLSLPDAEAMAVKNHPRVSTALLEALAANQVPIELRSTQLPQMNGAITGAGALDGSRLSAGALNNPIIYNRLGAGVVVSQLLTDFGRTSHLIESAKLSAKARQEFVTATRAEVLLQVDRSYYAALRAQAVAHVAEETVRARQVVYDQVAALAKSKLRSGLDLSFAAVNLAEAKLLESQARNSTDSAFADLSAALGLPGPETFDLTGQPVPEALSGSAADRIAGALRQRPELAVLRLEHESALQFTEAERDLTRPTLAAIGAAGGNPAYDDTHLRGRYAAAGVTLTIPVFNGGLFAARRTEAELRAKAIVERTRDLANRISRDVQVAWLNASTAWERVGLTEQLLEQARQALDLAQARYQLGLSSIVELSQAQLNLTSAEIAQSGARYDYQIQRAVLSYQTGTLR